MNPDLTVTNASSSVPQIQNPKSKIKNVICVSSGHKRNGKIARLPKALRDKINQSIDDGHTYPQIIKDLGDDAKDLKPGHFSEWRKGGYEDYLRHQEWRDQLRIVRENGSEMSELADSPKFQETLIQVALTEIFRVLQQGELKPDSLNYIRLFNALARLNREALGLRKYNDHLAKEEVQLKHLDPKRKLSDNEHRAIADIIDQVMEMPRPRPLWSAPAERSGDGALADHGQEPSNAVTETPAIENPTSKFANSPDCLSSPSSSSSPLPSRPCRAEVPDSADSDRNLNRNPFSHDVRQLSAVNTEEISPIQNPKSEIENCLECGTALPPVPPDARRRPEDHCPSCGMRLPDIGLCDRPGFDKCLNCGATQPHLLPNGERPRQNCHTCGERLHNPDLPAT